MTMIEGSQIAPRKRSVNSFISALSDLSRWEDPSGLRVRAHYSSDVNRCPAPLAPPKKREIKTAKGMRVCLLGGKAYPRRVTNRTTPGAMERPSRCHGG